MVIDIYSQSRVNDKKRPYAHDTACFTQTFVILTYPILSFPILVSLLHAAWPDDDVDMGSGDHMSSSQLDAALRSAVGLLPPLEAEAGEGFSGPQQVLASLVSRRFKVSSPPSVRHLCVCVFFNLIYRLLQVCTVVVIYVPFFFFLRFCTFFSVVLVVHPTCAIYNPPGF